MNSVNESVNMQRLSMAFLGQPYVKKGNQPLEFRTRKALALLIYLAVEGGLHSRESLATLLWPDQEARKGRDRLRTTLYYLRQALGGDNGESEQAAHVIASRDHISFNFEANYELDVAELRSLERDSGLERVRAAAGLYRGDFLAGFASGAGAAFQDWAAERRQELHIKINGVLNQLSQRLAERGQTEEALRVAQRWSNLDPLNEQAYRRLMVLHLHAGNRAAADEAYAACRRVFDEELNSEPSPETVALAERIRRQPPIQIARPAQRRRPPTERLPFVGRAEEHELLVKEFEEAAQRDTRVVLLEGEAGIGKSRLVSEWLGWAETRGAAVMEGQAFDVGGRLPYQPLTDAFRPAVSNAELLTEVDKVWLAELARLFPEVRTERPGISPPEQDSSESTRLFESFVQLGLVISKSGPLVLHLDDVQWVDAATRDLLTYAVSRWNEESAPVLVILTLREQASSMQPGEPPLSEMLGRRVPLSRVTLGPLSEAETEQWVHRLAAVDAEPASAADPAACAGHSMRSPEGKTEAKGSWAALARRLFKETKGHPFFLTETVKGLLDRGLLRWDRTPQGGWRIEFGPQSPEAASWGSMQDLIAPSVRQAVRARLREITDDMFTLLVAAAVLGPAARFSRLCVVADISEDRALLPLDQLTEARLLKEVPSAAGAVSDPLYSFVHDQIRKVTYAQAGGARQRLFHRRAYELLETGTGSAAELAHHAQAAGLGEAAVRHRIQAGREALEVFAVQDAIRYLKAARTTAAEVLDLGAAFESAELQALYEQLGRAYEIVNDWDGAHEVYRELLEIAEARDLQRPQVSARLKLASLWVQRDFDVDRAADLLEKARSAAVDSDDEAGLAEAEWRLSTVNYFRFRREAALEHAERALDMARRTNDPELIAGSLNALGYASQGVGRWSGVRAPLEEALELYHEKGDQAMEVDCRLMLAVGRLHMGAVKEALALISEAQDQLKGVENPWGKANIAWVRGQVLIERGRYQDAIGQASAGLKIASENDILPLAASALAARGVVNRNLAQFQKALADHLRAEELLEQMPNPHFPPVLAPHLCVDYALTGDWDRAFEHARRAVTDVGRAWLHSATWLGSGFHHWSLVEALLRAGEKDLGKVQLDRFDKLAGDNPRYQIPAARSWAVWALAQDDLEGAIGYVEQAQRLSRELGLSDEEARHSAELAQLYAEVSDHEAANRARERAGQLAAEVAGWIEDESLRADYLGWYQDRGIHVAARQYRD